MTDYLIRRMTEADIDAVLEVERQSFTIPWSREAFAAEMKDNDLAYYLVLVYKETVVGYAGTWIILDEAHVTNIAVLPAYQNKGFGEMLLSELIRQVRERGVDSMTLEVRVTNDAAKNLYTKLGFQARGLRKGYYSDIGEDAMIMWLDTM